MDIVNNGLIKQVEEYREEDRNRKLQNMELVEKMEIINHDDEISEKTIERIHCCSTYMRYLHGMGIDCDTGEMLENKRMLVQANRCGNRFCPICSKNESRKQAIRLRTMMDALTDQYDYRYILLTLTVPNCLGSELSDKLTVMNIAYHNLTKRKMFMNAVKGHIKKVEVTYNSDNTSPSYDTYHPHFHILLAVDSNYFTNPHKYISRQKWLKAWQELMKDNTITQVDVRKTDTSCVMEMSKYLAKDSDYLYSPEVFRTFYTSLKHRRMLTYSGCFKQSVSAYEQGLLDNYKSNLELYVSRIISGTWEKKDYKTNIINLSDISENLIKQIDEKLKERGYSFSRLNDNEYLVKYVGNTTIGDGLVND